jgi:imidazolonepropionase-like amidohydrolase
LTPEGAVRHAHSMKSISILATLVGAFAVLSAAPEPKSYIWADRIIAVPGEAPILNGTIIVADGKIERVSPGFARVPRGETFIDLRGQTVMPGFIDSHVHITSENGPNGRLNEVTQTASDQAIIGVTYARRTLDAGFTTVADLGADNEAIFALRAATNSGAILGPRIVATGGAISVTGGHGDINGFRPDIMNILSPPSVCNGADDCRRAVRYQVRAGADMIKITATGGVLSNTAAGLGQQFLDDELKAIVDTAKTMGRQVVAHAHGVDGINAALRAGVSSIEHGSYLDAESIRLFRENGAYLVPTTLAGATVTEEANRPGTWMPLPVATKARTVGPLMVAALRRAREGGVKVAFGTDSGVSRHGDNAREFELMIEAGFTPIEAIRCATINGADHLNLSDRVGRLLPGMDADIVATTGDPTRNISRLRDIRFVMRAGVVAKNVGRGTA